jgi:hypothetical protein
VYPEIDAEAIMSAHFLLAGPLLAGAILGPVAAARDGVPSSGRAPAADWVGQANQSFASFGVSIAAAGDVNGDGYGDVIVGASEFDNGQLGEGKAFVYHGSPAGLPATPDWSVEGGQVGANFGVSVGAAGDVNGDGYDDVIVGANFYDNGQTDEGRAYVYHGSASGLSPTPNWIAEGNQADAVFGYSSRTAGDVNGDGYDDVIVGAMAYDNGELDEGRAYVYLGSPKGLRRRPRWTAEGNQPGAQGGCACFGYSVGTAGDVNGDGYDDVVVGAPFQDNGQNNEGRAYVYLGSPLGPGKQAAWTGEGDQENAYFGRAVGAAGDVNGDGYDDIVVGADYYDQDQPDEGAAFVYHGSPSGPSVTAQWIGDTSLGGTRYAASVGPARRRLRGPDRRRTNLVGHAVHGRRGLRVLRLRRRPFSGARLDGSGPGHLRRRPVRSVGGHGGRRQRRRVRRAPGRGAARDQRRVLRGGGVQLPRPPALTCIEGVPAQRT